MMKSIDASSPGRWTFFDHASPRCAAGKKLALRAQTIFPAGAPLRWHGTRKNLRIAPSEDAFPQSGGEKGKEKEYGH
jgi:hypothetical protein